MAATSPTREAGDQRLPAGSRIRLRRIDAGMRQVDLAAAVGISASYLNLIEHNRRRIAGRLLNRIGRALGLDPAALAEDSDGALVGALRGAAAAPWLSGPAPARPAEFAGRFPDWAGLVAAQGARIAALEDRVAALGDRLAHDPELAASLHQVIMAVTAIRSTSSILVGGEDLDRDWQSRFHRNIHAESLRLAESSRSLARFLEAPEATAVALTPQDEIARFLEAMDHHVPALEGAAPAMQPAEVAAGAPGLGAAARDLLTGWLTRYRADAAALPLEAVARGWSETPDPAELARRFGCDLATVLRRLAALPPGAGPTRAGLVICDAAGVVLHRRPLPGLTLPRGGSPCPLWPLYEALGQPGRPVRAVAMLPGDDAPTGRLLCYAVAGPRAPTGFDAAPLTEAVMLMLPDPAADAAGPIRAVGPGCRICPRDGCPARREPSILGR